MAAPDSVTHRYFGRDTALFVGPLPPATLHSHHAIQGCVALEGGLTIDVGGRAPLSTPAALIGADVPHALSAPGRVAHFYALPESATGSRLVGALSAASLVELDPRRLAALRPILLASLAEESRFPEALSLLLDLAAEGVPPGSRMDTRVTRVLETLRARSPDTPLATLAREAALSPDRLRHLIREQVGIPLRQVRRWTRLLAALDALRERGSVSAAAHDAGFADAAHLSRVFREAFTFPPSLFLRDSRFVQAGDRDAT